MVVVGGSAQTPGAIALAGLAALQAGAGKLRLVTVPETAASLGVWLPEARVYATLHQRGFGGALKGARAILVGPGLVQGWLARRLLERTLAEPAALILDALSLRVTRLSQLSQRRNPTVLTPHAGELRALLGCENSEMNPDHALQAARQSGCVVVAKGPVTWVASPGGDCLEHRGGNVGLATSGSGDVLAGVVAGLLARGCDPLQAAAWAVHLHGRSGEELRAPGYLARQLASGLPRLISETA